MRYLLFSLYSALFLILCDVLNGCVPKTSSPLAPAAQNQNLVAHISQEGAEIVQEGSRLQIILPVDTFFRGTSFDIQDNQVDTMHAIAQYLRRYCDQFSTAPLITVSGHTDLVFDRQTRLQRSRQYAETIAAFLWNDGFSRQALHVQGYGGQKPISNPRTMVGSGDNRRVVIQVN